MATAINAADGRHTHCSAAVVRAADGRRTIPPFTLWHKQQYNMMKTYYP